MAGKLEVRVYQLGSGRWTFVAPKVSGALLGFFKTRDEAEKAAKKAFGASKIKLRYGEDGKD